MTAYCSIMSDEARAHFSATKVQWTRSGWELSIQLAAEIAERVFVVAEEDLQGRLEYALGSSARVFYEPKTQSTLPRLVVRADQLFDADPVELRETIDEALKLALDAVVAARQHENTTGKEWLRAFGDQK